MNVALIFVIFFSLLATFLAALAFFTICSQNERVKARLSSEVEGRISKAVIEGELQSKFGQRRRLSVSCGMKAERFSSEIIISPQGRISEEALIETLIKD